MTNYKYGVKMNSDKNNKKIKPFLIAFVAFILILTCFSLFMFMRSIDYDFDNIYDGKQTETQDNEPKPDNQKNTVSSLSGKSNILFAVLGEESTVEYAFVVCTDFDKASMQVKVLDDSQMLTDLYKGNAENGLKDYVTNSYSIVVDKYAIFTKQQLKSAFSMFNGINLNVPESINYKSPEFNLLLDAGNQTVSSDIAYKYLMICDASSKENAICDIINSVLTVEYLENSESLFKKFVNSCVTDISIIDYSNSIEILNVYASAEDKFLPKPYALEE